MSTTPEPERTPRSEFTPPIGMGFFPGNAELAIWILALIVASLVCWISDTLGSADWQTVLPLDDGRVPHQPRHRQGLSRLRGVGRGGTHGSPTSPLLQRWGFEDGGVASRADEPPSGRGTSAHGRT